MTTGHAPRAGRRRVHEATARGGSVPGARTQRTYARTHARREPGSARVQRSSQTSLPSSHVGGACPGAPARMGESIPLAAPVPVEQAVLETFFSHLGIFSYDKAKDNVEKEREAHRSAGGSWLALLAALAHLAAAEKVYHSLAYLGQKLGTCAPHPGAPHDRPGALRPPSVLPRLQLLHFVDIFPSPSLAHRPLSAGGLLLAGQGCTPQIQGCTHLHVFLQCMDCCPR